VVVGVADWISATAALVAVCVAIAAFVRSGRATTAAEEAGAGARDAADEARRLANVEVQREHERLGPDVNIAFKLERSGPDMRRPPPAVGSIRLLDTHPAHKRYRRDR
jgi:hypothetical protein